MNSIYVLGSINIDYVVKTDEWPKIGQTLFGNSFLKNPGGKGANQAVALAKQGISTNFIGAVGDDFDGQEMIKNLKKYNINTDYISKVNETTGKAIIISANKDNQIIVIKGSNKLITLNQIDQGLSNSSMSDYFLTQFEVEPEVYEYGLKIAKEKGLTTIVNPSPVRNISKSLYENIDYLILNEHEAKLLSNMDYIGNELNVFNYFINQGVKQIVVTLGSKGVNCIYNDELILVEANKVDVIDTTAAGDTFLGAFVSKLIQSADMLEACRYGNIAGAYACKKIGAQISIPSFKDLN